MRTVTQLSPLALCVVLAGCGGGSSEMVGASTNAPEQNTMTAPASMPPTRGDSGNVRILAIGDSFFDYHVATGESIPDEIGKVLQQRVVNRAEGGAMFSGGDEITDIPDQYKAGEWDWVVLDGGGNDLNDKCGCNACDDELDALISLNSQSGVIPDLIARMRADDAQVVYMQYPEIPADAESGFAQCEQAFMELAYRVNQLALNTEGFWLVDASDVVPAGDPSFFVSDNVHPSIKGTAVIGEYLAQTIVENATNL